MPDRGFWTMRCQGCGKEFTIEVLPGERVVDFARTYACPKCAKTPDQHSRAHDATWHHVIDFRASRK